MPTLVSRNAWILLLLSAAVANSQDLRVKKSLNVDGKPVSTTEILIKGIARAYRYAVTDRNSDYAQAV